MYTEPTELEKVHQKLKGLEAKNQASANEHVRQSEIAFEAARSYRIAAEEISHLIFSEKQRILETEKTGE